MPSENYNIGCYLLDRLQQLGCGHLFGVPGDYNLRFLDDVMAQEKEKGFKWVGCANELNAAYAADGYGKCGKLAALLTTYGVGELSALNGIAGAMAESSPVVHIVGAPALSMQNQRLVMHHTLGEGVFQDFVKMSEPITCAQGCLTPENAKREIDRVLVTVVHQKKPGFLLLPADVAIVACEPPTAPLQPLSVHIDKETLKVFQDRVEKMLGNSATPALLAGYLCDRFRCGGAANELVESCNIPFAVMVLGKGVMDETLPQYVGTYCGSASQDVTKAAVEEADVCIHIGVKFHDFGSASFTQKFDAKRVIDIQPFHTTIDGQFYANLPMSAALEVVAAVAKTHCKKWASRVFNKPEGIKAPTDPSKFDAHHFWTEFASNLMPNDIVLTDQGTACCAGVGLLLPKGCIYISQYLWGSIGYALPATLGAQLAEPNRRVVLVVGDGASQMTIQELGSFVRYGLKPVIFLLNNDGYVIERVIHGWNEPYNDITSWDYAQIMRGMSRGNADVEVLKEVGAAARVLQATSRDKLVFREVMLGRHETPVYQLLKR
ncbi:Thiamine pyrophosphate enzyme, N-terminal TPP binding domain/Thiamine pyrophosphate enzyme, central domain/Thiamine pyrophosphate enzyme, C-terminal TPP binding domain containing protein, putative [Angomonas deanei]|uniref:Thiamine pyrophosphate enzyme, N-terminal TPP binding domain/Thiamine pyrophosphate enzyme, central domain/Thiamine pyrophosphate enzyme, C-terminal TPP binding domain containing protein, putative n=1 Tax=Angomonas deanei TaxID=59799 RepID=A0A7G2C500_9TRYP|nr:Thiamine pyrophosphate enzyme, N-terminal TPP binding domain/Thiamine pyrophosphate enzyme, central domain/Thiamine pyrophosphate enzyme, C-terminal TPP binding domain containing protein, putative [Angomonas deanei]